MQASSRRSVLGVLALALAVAGSATPADATRPTRAACRRECGFLIEACRQTGGTRAGCRRAVLRACRREGVPWCWAETTTTVSTTSSTSTSLDPGPTVHGCNRAQATDRRGEPLVVVAFRAFDYAPECVLVSAGTTVRFEGDFRAFPLIGGVATQPDPASPFAPPTTSGVARAVVLDTPGLYPYATDILWTALFRMWGAVLVE